MIELITKRDLINSIKVVRKYANERVPIKNHPSIGLNKIYKLLENLSPENLQNIKEIRYWSGFKTMWRINFFNTSTSTLIIKKIDPVYITFYSSSNDKILLTNFDQFLTERKEQLND